jgi:hypothetical protein
MGRPTNHRLPPAAERADAARGVPARRLDRLAGDLEDHGWKVVRRRRGESEVWRVSSAALERRRPGEMRRRRVILELEVEDEETTASDYPPPTSAVREPVAAMPASETARPGGAALLGVIDLLTPDLRVPSAAGVAQARRNAVARTELAQEFGLLTSREVADLAGSRARNRAALANRWTQEGRVFAVPHAGQYLWPGFQFDAQGQPLPVVSEVVAILAGDLPPWPLALWFTSRSGWLDGRRPADLLATEPAAVVEAARGESEQPAF